MNGIAAVWADAKTQWGENARLRMASWAVVGILWIYGLMLVSDNAPRIQAELGAMKSELAKLKGGGDAALWAQRRQDAEQWLTAAEALSWAEQRPGLAQAEIQDWLRGTATKAGMSVRELRLAAAEASPAASSVPAAGVVKLRLSVDFTPLALAGFLNELGEAERGVMVERLQLKTWTKPQQADLDIRVRLRQQGGRP